MADELNIPTHRWYERRNNIALAKQDFSKQWIYDSGIQKIDRWINSQPWGNPIPGLFSSTAIGIWLDPSDVANLTWRRNLLTWTEQFDNAAWVKFNGSISSVNVAAPDGTLTAERFTPGSQYGYLRQVLPAQITSGSVTLSVWLRAAGGNTAIYLRARLDGFDYPQLLNITSQWVRYTATFTYDGVTPLTDFAIQDRNASGFGPIEIWGAQLELGTSATDYQRISDVNTEVIERFPTATMYQDAAGTTAVTTPGQPVGLRLDKSKGLALGADVVVNGTFDANLTGWTTTAPATATWNAGQVNLARNGGSSVQNLYQLLSLTAGKSYKFTITVSALSNTVSLFSTGGGAAIGTAISAVGSYTFTYLWGVSDTGIYVGLGGTTSATATVDNISVRELAGNHATQSVLASRPVYGIEPAGGRRNLLLWSASASTSPWSFDTSTGAGITLTGGLASDGVTQFAVFNEGTSTSAHRANQSITISAAAPLTVSAEFKAGTSRYVLLGTNRGGIAIDTDNWTITQTIAAAVTTTNGTITPLGDGLYRASVTVSHATDTTIFFVISTATTGTPGTMTPAFAGTSRTAVFTFAQAELGSTATNYQRVTSAFDVTEAGVQSCHYVQYDGSDDGMITNSIDFSGTNKASMFAGVRKISDAGGYGLIAELSVATGAPGTFGLFASGAATYHAASAVSATSSLDMSSYPAPINNVISSVFDNAGATRADAIKPRVNGAIPTITGGVNNAPGTGNFGHYPLYLGRRGGASLPLNGRDYGIVVVGKATTADEITSTERWLSGKTGFYAPIITGVPTIGVS